MMIGFRYRQQLPLIFLHRDQSVRELSKADMSRTERLKTCCYLGCRRRRLALPIFATGFLKTYMFYGLVTVEMVC